jgi:hypothetical protein
MMPDAQELFDALCDPFPLEYIEWRVGSTTADKSKGLPLCYIDARAVMDRLDSVCGPDGWQCNYSPAPGNAIICNIGILIAGDWIWKADGAGATDVEGEKGMLSDALKRAAVRWGVGRYLYDLKAPWVELEAAGRSHKIKDSERKKLDTLHEDFALKCGWGLRAGVQAYKLMNSALKEWVHDPAAVIDFRAKHAGMIAQLPVGMRKHLNETLDRIGATRSEAAE